MTSSEILPAILQAGAIGLLAMIFGIAYKLISQYLDLKSKQSQKEEPPRPTSNYDYNEQNARIIYDVSKTLSETVVILGNVAAMNADILKEQKKSFEILKDHTKAFDDFMRRYETRILNKEKTDAH